MKGFVFVVASAALSFTAGAYSIAVTAERTGYERCMVEVENLSIPRNPEEMK